MGGLGHHFFLQARLRFSAWTHRDREQIKQHVFQLLANIEFMIWIFVAVDGRDVSYKLWSDNAINAVQQIAVHAIINNGPRRCDDKLKLVVFLD